MADCQTVSNAKDGDMVRLMRTIPYNSSDSLKTSHSSLFTGMFLFAVLGMYCQFHLYSGSAIAFPFVVSNAVGLGYLGAFFNRAMGVNAVFLAVAFILFSVPYAMFGLSGGYLVGALSKHLQLLTSLVAGYGIFMLLLEIHHARLARIMSRLAIGILVFAILEVYFGFHPTMVAINSVLYSWRPNGFYVAEGRDLANWGIIRPLVFSTEPSLVGIWGSTLMICATILSRSTDLKRYFFLIAYAGLLLLATRSTTAALILIFYLIGSLFDGRSNVPKQIIIVVVSLVVSSLLVLSSLGSAIGQYMLGTSYFARVLGPYLTALDVLREAPLFGLGPGNEMALERIVFEVWQRAGMLSVSSNYIEAWGINGMLTNNFFWNWIYFGLMGGICLLSMVIVIIRRIGHFPLWSLLFTFVGVWMTLGGFVDLRTWFFFFLIAACLISFERSRSEP